MNNSTPIPDGYKRCSKDADCKHPDGPILPATTEYFYKKTGGLYGLYSRCKTCHNAITIVNAVRWQKAYPEKKREAARKWQKAHPGKHNANNRKWRADNRKKIKQYNVHYRENNPDILKVTKQRYRSRKASLPESFTLDDWNRALNYFNGCCAVCGRQLNDLFDEHTAAMDHWIPVSSPDCPGTITLNIVPLCHGVGGCNNSKNSNNPLEWLEQKFGKRKAKQIKQRIEDYFDYIRECC